MPTANSHPFRFLSISYRFCQAIILFGLCSLAGCERGAIEVAAEPRNSPYQPSYAADAATESAIEVSSKQRELAQQLPFLTRDTSICLRLRIESLFRNPQLANVDWNTFEDQLGRIFGHREGTLSDLENIWLVIQGNDLGTLGSRDSSNPLIYVLQTFDAIDETSWSEATESRDVFLTENELACSRLNPFTIAIGPTDSITRLESRNDTSVPLILEQVEQWDMNTDLCGAVRFEAIRPMLQPFASMFGRFVPNAEKLSELPDSLNSALLSIDLDAKEMAKLEIDIQNAESFLDVTKSLISMASSGSGLASGMEDFANGGSSRATMIDPVSTQLMEAVSREIENEKLFSVVAKENQIRMTLGRPKSLDAAIKGLVIDIQNQLDLALRVERYQKIADALAEYAEKYGQLPPLGPVTQQQSEESGIPQQFNWRVGILQFLEAEDTYRQFDFSKSWDAPENQKVEMPEVFHDGAMPDVALLQLNAFDGGLYSQSDRPIKISSIEDNVERTAIAFQTNVPEDWLSPPTNNSPPST